MDIINIEIEDDGTVSFKTTDVSKKNHLSADDFLDQIEDFLGTKRKTEKREHTFMKNKQVLRGGRIVKA